MAPSRHADAGGQPDMAGEEEECFEPIDKLISYGIDAGDVKKLQDAGIKTCNGVLMLTKESLSGIKGLSEAKVDEIREAAKTLLSQEKNEGHHEVQAGAGRSHNIEDNDTRVVREREAAKPGAGGCEYERDLVASIMAGLPDVDKLIRGSAPDEREFYYGTISSIVALDVAMEEAGLVENGGAFIIAMALPTMSLMCCRLLKRRQRVGPIAATGSRLYPPT